MPSREVWYCAISDFPNGLGSTTRARSICRAIKIVGYQPRLVIPYAIGHALNFRPAGEEGGILFEYLNKSTKRPRGTIRVGIAKINGSVLMARRLKASHYRVACVFLYNPSILDYWALIRVARHLGIPLVADFTDEWRDFSMPLRRIGLSRLLYQMFTRATEDLVFDTVDRIIVVSCYLLDRLARFRKKIIKLPMLFEPKDFELGPFERLADKKEFSIIYAGSLSRTEGANVLIKAFELLHKRFPAVRLSIIGNTQQGELLNDYKKLAEKSGIDKYVKFFLSMPRYRYIACIRGADALVIPRSTSSASKAGFPYKLGEYLATGVPVVVTRFGDVKEYFTDKVHCLICAPDDPEDLANTMSWLVRNPGEARIMGRAGQARVRELFGHEAKLSQIANLLKTLEKQ